jgi:hypothetical protein
MRALTLNGDPAPLIAPTLTPTVEHAPVPTPAAGPNPTPALEDIKVIYAPEHVVGLYTQHQTIARFLSRYSADCTFHHLIRSSRSDVPHSTIEGCDADFGRNSLYRGVWRGCISFRVSGLCFVCGGSEVYGHNSRFGRKFDNQELLLTLRAIAFISLNSLELREVVFPIIGVDPAPFLVNQITYARWLGYPGYANRNGSANLTDILYAVAVLHEAQILPRADATFVTPPGS